MKFFLEKNIREYLPIWYRFWWIKVKQVKNVITYCSEQYNKLDLVFSFRLLRIIWQLQWLTIALILQVKFPSTVRWMTLEFDPKCGTAQIEDSLQLFVPGRGSKLQPPSWNTSGEANGQMDKSQWWTVLHKFYGSYPGNWPTMAVILPGMSCIFAKFSNAFYYECSMIFRNAI